jgi:hypothetical protein
MVSTMPTPRVKTIGNATLIVMDPEPLLVTDPWIGDVDDAYFGSWTLSHHIPEEEKREILAAPYVWFSHGHPDHLNPTSLDRFKSKTVLLPDHVGGRIKRDLEALGFQVRVLPDRKWTALSERVRLFCISDYIQDAALLIDVAGRLFLNLNDCGARGAIRLIRRITRGFADSYLLQIACRDADMMHFVDAEGRRCEPFSEETMPGAFLAQRARLFGAKNVIPFSSFHQYQREDSVWANQYVTPVDGYRRGFDDRAARYIEPFAAIDCGSGAVAAIRCEPKQVTAIPAAKFGDSWSDQLDETDEELIRAYFARRPLLGRFIGFIEFVVGGKSLIVTFPGPPRKGVTFHVPASSLMTAIRYEIFDDLLIGNFMKTRLHNIESLYEPPINPVITKFGDNGRVETAAALRTYMAEYRRRSGGALVLHLLEEKTGRIFRRHVSRGTPAYDLARRLYYLLPS